MNDLTVVGLEWLGALALFLGFILLVRYLNHRERMMLIERGLLDQLDAERPRTPRSSAMLRGGLITAMVGLAVTLGLRRSLVCSGGNRRHRALEPTNVGERPGGDVL